MRVGILTFHYAPNYGAVLQALGLQTVLREIGHEPVFINYIPKYMRKRLSPLRGWGLGSGFGFCKKFLRRLHEQKRRAQIASFVGEQLNTTKHIKTSNELLSCCSKLDAVIVGSDQVWNLKWQDKFDDTYFLGFLDLIKRRELKRIAYGPCFGSPDQPTDLLERAVECIRKFDAIGMRNNFGVKILKAAGLHNVSEIIDPAFFVNSQRSAVDIAIDKNAIAVYAVSASTADLCSAVARRARKEFNRPIIQVASENYIKLSVDNYELLCSANPVEWQQLIANASFVCSESFHGVVFALKNSVPFVAASQGSRAHRIEDLLAHYDLKHHLVKSEDQIQDGLIKRKFEPEGRVSSQIEADMIFSRKFLKEALG